MEKIILHERYSSLTEANDIALMKVTPPVVCGNLVGPGCLPLFKAGPPRAAQSCWVTGWGFLGEKGESGRGLQGAGCSIPSVHFEVKGCVCGGPGVGATSAPFLPEKLRVRAECLLAQGPQCCILETRREARGGVLWPQAGPLPLWPRFPHLRVERPAPSPSAPALGSHSFQIPPAIAAGAGFPCRGERAGGGGVCHLSPWQEGLAGRAGLCTGGRLAVPQSHQEREGTRDVNSSHTLLFLDNRPFGLSHSRLFLWSLKTQPLLVNPKISNFRVLP